MAEKENTEKKEGQDEFDFTMFIGEKEAPQVEHHAPCKVQGLSHAAAEKGT